MGVSFSENILNISTFFAFSVAYTAVYMVGHAGSLSKEPGQKENSY